MPEQPRRITSRTRRNGLLLTLPLLQRPMLAVLERLLGLFQP